MHGVTKGVAVATSQPPPCREEVPQARGILMLGNESQQVAAVVLANRCLQPLGHLSAGRSTYETQQPPSNRCCESGESGESSESAQPTKVVTVTIGGIPLFDRSFARVPGPATPGRTESSSRAGRTASPQKESQHGARR